MSQAGDTSLIGDGLRIEGNIDSESDLLVEGEVKGDIAVRKLTLGSGGNIEGKVTVDEITIHGRLTGGVVTRSATLCRTAKVTGDIEYESLSIEEGAEFDGRCSRRGQTKGSAEPTLLEAVGTR